MEADEAGGEGTLTRTTFEDAMAVCGVDRARFWDGNGNGTRDKGPLSHSISS